MTFLKVISLNFLLLCSPLAFSADDIPLPPSLEQSKPALSQHAETPPPSLPELENDSRNIPQPEVRIIHKKDTVIEEYRINGHLRYIKITPTVGKPYYMVDTDGDGVLETRENDLDNPAINRWILLEW